VSQLPSDLTFRVGQDYTLKELFRAAIRQWRRNFWPATGYFLLVGAMFWLPVGFAVMVLSCGCMMLGFPVGAPFFAVAYILAGIHLMSGYGWSVVCTFDNRRMQAGDLFYGFRTRYGPLALLGLLEMVAMGVPAAILLATGIIILVQSGGTIGAGMLPSIGFGAALIVGLALMVLVPFAAHGFFFLAPLFMFTGQAVTWRDCLRGNWRVLRHRTKAFLVIFLLPLSLLVVLGLLGAGAIALMAVSVAADSPLVVLAVMFLYLVVPLLSLAISGLFYVFHSFLKAALFRAANGYTLEVPSDDEPAAA